MSHLLRFERARARYSLLVAKWYAEETARRGYGYGLVDIAPSTLHALEQAVVRSQLTHKPFPVWKGGSTDTVFPDAHHNYMFRYLHDHEHVQLHMTLSVEDERLLGMRWAWRVLGATGDEDTALVAQLDTLGQTNYYAEHGRFPAPQIDWVREQFRDNVLSR